MNQKCDSIFWAKKENNEVKCSLCHHKCVIEEGRTGFCHVRENINGELILSNYGMVVSCVIDDISSRPIKTYQEAGKSLTIGLTGCNVRCSFCQNFKVSQVKKYGGSEWYSPEDIVNLSVSNNVDFISFTYSEPIVWFEYFRDVVELAKMEGKKVCLKTAGNISREHVDVVLDLVDVLNVDIKPLEKTFLKESQVSVDDEIFFIKRAIDRGIHTEVSYIIIEGVNDNEESLNWFIDEMKERKDLPIHLLKHIPAFHSSLNSTSKERLVFCRDLLKEFFNNLFIEE